MLFQGQSGIALKEQIINLLETEEAEPDDNSDSALEEAEPDDNSHELVSEVKDLTSSLNSSQPTQPYAGTKEQRSLNVDDFQIEILRVTMNKYLYSSKPNEENFETTTTVNEDINAQTSADSENNLRSDERNTEINQLKETINSLKKEITNIKEERDSLQLVLKIIMNEKDIKCKM